MIAKWARRVGRMSRRSAIWAIGAVFTLVVALQFVTHFGATNAGRPYEGWDEIANFNTSYVVNSADAPLRTYRYGPLDTFMQWSAVVGYEWLDPIGPTVENIRFSNVAPESWDDPYVMFKPKTWSGTDYNYFRGVDDHEPIFLSRQIHLTVGYLILLLTGYLVLLAYGRSAVFVLIPLLTLSVAPETAFQMTQSLPNGINALLAFGVILFALTYAYRLQARWLVTSGIYLAAALNFKADAVLLCSAPILAVGLSWIQVGWRFALASAVKSAVFTIFAFLILRPTFLLHPLQDLRIAYHTLAGSGYDLADPDKFNVFSVLQININRIGVLVSNSLLWPGVSAASSIGILVITASAVVIFLIYDAWRRQSVDTLAPVIGVLVSGMLWLAIAIKGTNIADRYFLNGFAACLATLAIAGVIFAARSTKLRGVLLGLLTAFALTYAGHATWLAKESLATDARVAAFDGFDPIHHRNQASAEAIKMVASGQVAPTVLVDQHSYTDLRMLRLNSVDARYVNMSNLNATLAHLAPGRYLVIFSRGAYSQDTARKFEHPWNGLDQRYDAYQAQLLSLANVQRFSGPLQRVRSFAPIAPDDDLYLSTVTIR